MDPLTILITGDISGITTAVKQALNVVQGGVDAMNDQTVDWTGIFSRAISPAVITGVASTIAFAIQQSLAFQNAIAQTGTAAGDTQSQIAALGSNSLDLSTTVPASAQDLANAMTQVGTIFGQNSATTTALTQDMAELSASGFGPLNDIVSASMELFKQYGVTTQAGAVTALTDLMHAAQGANESIPTLASQFDSFSTQLPEADKNLGTVNDQLSSFAAEIVAVGPTTAAELFSALASAAQGAAPQMAAVGLSAAAVNKSLQTDGGLSSLNTASTILQKMGSEAALVATAMGLSATQVEAFQQNSQYLSTVDANAKKIATSTMSISDAFTTSNSAVRAFELLWNTAVKDVQSATFTTLGTDFATTMTNMLNDATATFGGITDVLGSAFSIFYGNNLEGAAKGVFQGLEETFTSIFVNPVEQSLTGILNALGIKGASGIASSAAPAIANGAASVVGVNALGALVSLLGSLGGSASGNPSGIAVGGSAPVKNTTATFNNTFNIASAASPATTTQQIQKALYNQYQGTQ